MITSRNLYDTKIITNSTVTYKLKKKVINKPTTSLSALILLSKNKKFVTKGLKIEKLHKRELVDFQNIYFGQHMRVGCQYIQFDVKNCYPSIAVDIGLLQNHIYRKMNKLRDKSERLMILGAMSSSKKIEKINLSTGECTFEKKDPINKDYFFSLIFELSQILIKVEKVLKKYDFTDYFFYADAVFIDFQRFSILKTFNNVNVLEKMNLGLTKNVNFVEKGVFKLTEISEKKKKTPDDKVFGKFLKFENVENLKTKFYNIERYLI